MAPDVPEVAPVVGSPLTTSYEPRSHDFARVDGSAANSATSASSGNGPWVGAGVAVVDGELVAAVGAARLPRSSALADGSVAGAPSRRMPPASTGSDARARTASAMTAPPIAIQRRLRSGPWSTDGLSPFAGSPSATFKASDESPGSQESDRLAAWPCRAR